MLAIASASICTARASETNAVANTNLHPSSVTVDGVAYSLKPSSVEISMVSGKGDREAKVTIVAPKSGAYGFSVHGYGEGLPIYGVITDLASGGAEGNVELTLCFHDSRLPSDGDKPKKYHGYLPIHIFHGSETGADKNFMYVEVTITVNPANPKP
jgi:hypothetical protein